MGVMGCTAKPLTVWPLGAIKQLVSSNVRLFRLSGCMRTNNRSVWSQLVHFPPVRMCHLSLHPDLLLIKSGSAWDFSHCLSFRVSKNLWKDVTWLKTIPAPWQVYLQRRWGGDSPSDVGDLILYSHQIPSAWTDCAISFNPSYTLVRKGFLSPVYKGENGFPHRSINFLKDKPLQNTKVCFTQELTFLPIMPEGSSVSAWRSMVPWALSQLL